MIIDQPVVSGSFFVTGSSTLVGNLVVTGSISATEGIVVSGSIASASYASNAEKLDGLDSTAFVLTSSYNPVSSSLASRITVVETTYATTGSNIFTSNQTICGNLTTTGTITAQTLNVQQVTSSIVYSSGSNIFGNQLTDTQQLTGSVTVTGSLKVNDSPVVLTNQTSSMTVLSSSYASTASYVLNAISASWAATSSVAISATRASTVSISGVSGNQEYTFILVLTGSSGPSLGLSTDTVTGLFYNPSTNLFRATNIAATGSLFGTSSQAVSSSYALTASYSENVPLTSSYALEALTASYAVTASYSANVPVTSSYALQALSASYSLTASQAVSSSTSLTASYVQNAQSASYVLNAVSASYAQTSSYSLSGTGFPFSGSAVITGSLLITNLSGSGVRYVVTDANGLMTAQTASTVIKTTQTYTASAGQTTFSVTNGYSTGYVDVFINGSKLNNTEFTDTSGTNVVLATGSFSNDIVEVVKYLPAQGVSNNVLRTLTTFTAAASQSTFNVDYTPGLIDIFYNGSRLSPVEFTANNGTSFTLATASAAGDTLDVLVYSYQVGAYAGIGGSGQLNQVSYYTTTSSISGSNNFTFDGSTLRVTGSIITSGSSTFTNIGPTILSGSVAISGSLTVTQGVTISGSIASASYAANAELLDNLDSTAFVFTSSFNTYSSSMSSRTTTLEQASASLNTASGSFSTRVTRIEGNYATTGSNIFTGAQTVCANITSTGTIIAQTLNVQQVTSSIVYSSGSNIFGCDISNVQQMTGSVRITGSLNVIGNSCMTSVCSPAFVGGTVCGTSAYFNNNSTSNVVFFQNNDGTTTLGNSFSTVHRNANDGNGRYSLSRWQTQNASGLDQSAFIGVQAVTGVSNYNPNLVLGISTGASSYTTYLTIANTGTACFACQVCAPTVLSSGTICSTGNACFGGATIIAGCVGIGTATPTQKLDVAGKIRLTDDIQLDSANPTIAWGSGTLRIYDISSAAVRLTFQTNGAACFACELTAKTLGTNDLILNNLNYECANYVDGTRGSWLIQEGACDLFIINQVSGKKYKFNLIEIK